MFEAENRNERAVLFIVAVVGMLYCSTLIGFVVENVVVRMDHLRRGHYPVVVSGHHLILGWNQVILEVVRELSLSMAIRGGGRIVILANKPKEEMDVAIRGIRRSLRGITIVTRQGDPSLTHHVELVRPWTAKSLILLAPNSNNATASDSKVTRILLSLRGLERKLQGHVVAELSDPDHAPIAEMVAGALDFEALVMHEVMSRFMVQSLYEPGLTGVWTSLLGFAGSEIYLKSWKQLDGMSFGNVLTMFASAVPIGVLRST